LYGADSGLAQIQHNESTYIYILLEIKNIRRGGGGGGWGGGGGQRRGVGGGEGGDGGGGSLVNCTTADRFRPRRVGLRRESAFRTPEYAASAGGNNSPPRQLGGLSQSLPDLARPPRSPELESIRRPDGAPHNRLTPDQQQPADSQQYDRRPIRCAFCHGKRPCLARPTADNRKEEYLKAKGKMPGPHRSAGGY